MLAEVSGGAFSSSKVLRKVADSYIYCGDVNICRVGVEAL